VSFLIALSSAKAACSKLIESWKRLFSETDVSSRITGGSGSGIASSRHLVNASKSRSAAEQ